MGHLEPGSQPLASSTVLVGGPGSCPHFLPFLAPAVGRTRGGGKRKGREGPGAQRGAGGGRGKAGEGTLLRARDGQEQRPGTRAQPLTLPEQVRARAPVNCPFRTSYALTPSTHRGPGFPTPVHPSPLKPSRGTPTQVPSPHARLPMPA